MKKIIYFGVVLLVFLYSCRKPERFSDIPEIKFINFEEFREYLISNDTIIMYGGTLAFYFQDGDGDIGLDDWMTSPPFDYNFFCNYYEKQYGTFVKIDSMETIQGKIEPFNLNARIPRLSYLPEESISGEIYITMPQYRDSFSEYDTVKLEFYIVDRKLNKSNVKEVIIIR
jgi:hypothetical protein